MKNTMEYRNYIKALEALVDLIAEIGECDNVIDIDTLYHAYYGGWRKLEKYYGENFNAIVAGLPLHNGLYLGRIDHAKNTLYFELCKAEFCNPIINTEYKG